MAPQSRHLLFRHAWGKRSSNSNNPDSLTKRQCLAQQSQGKILRHPAANNASMMIMSWNIRGAGGSTKHMALREMISDYRPFMIIVMDTRMSFANSMRVTGTYGYANHYIIPPAHDTQVGGFWFLWDTAQTSVILLMVQFWVLGLC